MTNKEVFEYYKDKEEFSEITEKYMMKYCKTENPQEYEAFYAYCVEKKIKSKKHGTEHENNYSIIEKWISENSKENGEVDKLKKYINIGEDIPYKRYNPNYNVPSQKWHLITSYFGQCIAECIKNDKDHLSEFWEKGKFETKKIRYYPLKLWMAETAGIKEVIQIGTAIDSSNELQEANNILKKISWDKILEQKL